MRFNLSKSRSFLDYKLSKKKLIVKKNVEKVGSESNFLLKNKLGRFKLLNRIWSSSKINTGVFHCKPVSLNKKTNE